MKIELTEAEADRSLHAHHTEVWVQVLSNEPIGPQDWEKIRLRLNPALLAGYEEHFCQFYAPDDPEDESFAFEQWFILPSTKAVKA